MNEIQNDSNNLYWVFTKYATQRLSNLQTEDYLYLYKFGVGDYNWYEDPNKLLGDGGYTEGKFKEYFLNEGTTLGRNITGGTVYINNKSVNGDKVTFKITIPEDNAGYDIREVGIYETVGGVDHLFAVCCMQPIPKPTIDTGHYLSVEFNAILHSANLAKNYEKIVLDPENNFATSDEIEEFQENLLFVEANLAQQISTNAELIGLNRPQQLYEQIQSDKKKFSNFTSSTAYSNFLNATSLQNVRAFWLFNKTTDVTKKVSIADLSYYNISLETNKLSTQYEQGYEGLASWLNFIEGDYYKLSSTIDFDLLTEDKTADSPFTFIFVGANNESENDHTLIAKDSAYETDRAFNIKITNKRQASITLYTNDFNYTEFVTPIESIPRAGEFYVLSISYDYTLNGNILIPEVTVYINAKKVNTYVYRTGTYKGMKPTSLSLTSYFWQSGNRTNYVNSKVCLMTLVKDKLTEDYIRATHYNLLALTGKDPCLIR